MVNLPLHVTNKLPTLGKYLDKVDKVMAEVDRISEDISQIPVASFIFRDKESDAIQYSETRYVDEFSIVWKLNM